MRPRCDLSVPQAAQAAPAASTAATVSITTSVGSLLVLWTAQHANSTSTVAITDSAGQLTWAQVGGYVTPGSDSQREAMWYIANSAAVTSVTATWSGGLSSIIYVVIFEITGAQKTNVIDGTPIASTAITLVSSLTSGTLTTANGYDIFIYGVATNSTETSFTSGTLGGSASTIPTNGQNARLGMQYAIRNAIFSGATSMSWTATTSHAGSMFAAFKGFSATDDDTWDVKGQTNPDPNITVWG